MRREAIFRYGLVRRTRLRALVCVVLAVVLAGFALGGRSRAEAHSPHDDVSDIAVSPSYADDGKIFVVAANRLLVSTGGPYGWQPLARGLPRAPESGKSLARLAISPSDSDTMYVTSRVGGVYRSTDGGSSWHQAANGIATPDLTPIAVSPSSEGVVIAGGSISGLYRTVNGGESWTRLSGFERVVSIAFVPDSDRVLVGDAGGSISVSDDDGATWRSVARSGDGGIAAIAATSGVVFAGTTTGVLMRSDDGGDSFLTFGEGLPSDAINSLVLSPYYAQDHTLWASASSKGVYRSTDAGETWRRTSRGLTTDEQAQTVDVSDFRTIAVAPSGGGGIELFSAGFDGLFRSSDGGDDWVAWETIVDFVVGLGVSPDYENDSTVVAATYVKGAFLSRDAGTLWSPIDEGLEHELSAGNKFAPIRRLHNIAFSPEYATDQTLFSATWTHFLKSTNQGKSWSTIEVSPPPAETSLRQFVIGLSPDYAADHSIFLGTRQGDIYRSKSAGDAGSWEHVGNAGSRVRSLAFSPSFPAERVLYAGTEDGVVESADAGATWSRTGPRGVAMLAISPGYATDGTLFAGTDAALFVTRDKAQTWTELTVDRLGTGSSVEAIVVSPAYDSDGTLLVSITGEGLYRSTDGGASFSAIGLDLIEANRVIADFTNPTETPIEFSPSFERDRTVFAYANQDVLRSTNAGETWEVLRLPAASTVFSLDRADGDDVALSSRSHGTSRRAVVLVAGLAGLAMLSIAATIYGIRRHAHANSQKAS